MSGQEQYYSIAVKSETKDHFELFRNDISREFGRPFTHDEALSHLLDVWVQLDLELSQNKRDEDLAPQQH